MNIVFDFGGVVFRWQPLRLLRETLPLRARDDDLARELAAELFQGYTPDGDWGAFDRGEIGVGTLAQRAARRTGLSEAEVLAFVQAVPAHLEPIAETVALLGRLKSAGHRLFYLSNMPAPFAEHLQRSHAFMAWFDDGVFSSQLQLMKPQPAIFHAAARRFGLAPHELLFIDDVAHNVDAARALGWQAIWFRDASQCAAALSAGAADDQGL